MSVATKPTIVVGVNGSSAIGSSLALGSRRGRPQDAQLKIVLIWNVEPRAYYAPSISPGDHDRRQEHAVPCSKPQCGLFSARCLAR